MSAPVPRPVGGSLAVALVVLRDALAVLDASDPDVDTLAFDRATDEVIAAVRGVAKAAVPLVEGFERLVGALVDAMAFRQERMECFCGTHAPSGVCPHSQVHRERLAAYKQLLAAVTVLGESTPSPTS